MEGQQNQSEQTKWWKHRLYDSENAKELNEKARKFWNELIILVPEVKLLTIVGSTVRGYSERGSSDLDLIVSIESNDDEKLQNLSKKISQFVEKFKKDEGQEMHVFLNVLRLVDDPYANIETARNLLYPTLGDASAFRDTIHNSLKLLSNESEKEAWKKRVVDLTVSTYNPKKAIERGMITEEEVDEYINSKRNLISQMVERRYINNQNDLHETEDI